MEINGLSKSARQKVKKRAKKEARKAMRPKTFYNDKGATFTFPIKNIRAAYWKAKFDNLPDLMGVTVWTNVKGARPQVIEVRLLKMIVTHIDELKDKYSDDIRVRITPTLMQLGSSTTFQL